MATQSRGHGAHFNEGVGAIMTRKILVALSFILFLPSLHAGEPGEKATIAYVQKLQTPSGAFLPQAPSADVKLKPTLKTTSTAVRILHYLGDAPFNKEAAIKYIASCYDPETGGFADVPKGKPDVGTTAIGIMAVKELKMPVDKYQAGAVKYLTENARGFEDIRIAAAGLEAIGAKSPKGQSWLDEVRKMQNSDGTFGKDAGQARDTGSAVVTILRLGGTPKDTNAVLKVLRDGQRPSGGFGKGDSEVNADLESSYRIMRCFMMLKAQPERVEGLRTFIAKCRNEDGGYGVAPGQPSSISGTYYAAIIRHWLEK